MTIVDDEPCATAPAAPAESGLLSDRLAVLDAQVRGRHPELCAAMDAAVARLAECGAFRAAPDVGDPFPDVILPDACGRVWRLATALREGPVALVFLRGDWCPFCELNATALARISSRVAASGCGIVAVSPQKAGAAVRFAAGAGADFPVLCDMGLGVSTALGLTYAVDARLRRALAALGVDIDARYDGAGWILPAAATFVLDRDGRVAARHVSPDPRARMEPETILQVASALQAAARS